MKPVQHVAFATVPDSTPRPSSPSRRDALLFAIRVLRADLANFFLWQYRAADAFLVTGKNSGTHWVKFMLSCAIARRHGVPPPAHASGPDSNIIVGHPSRPPAYPGLPRIGSSHTIPSAAFSWRLGPVLGRLFDHPPVVVLVRDIRQALLSNYVKWHAQYGCPLGEYLRGDPSGRRFVADIWWYVHFFNRWGGLARARPARVLIVHYEDVEAAPALWLRRIATHMALDLDDDAIAAALPFAAREAIASELDPNFAETIIPAREARQSVSLSPQDHTALDAILSRHLRHSLGYALPTRPHAASKSQARPSLAA